MGCYLLPGEEKTHEVLIAIRQIVRRISEHSKYLSRAVGLTVPQLLCLKAIGEMQLECHEITVTMVSERVQLSSPTVSRILDRLVRAGLVTRERGATDRRRLCLSLTPKGAARFQTLPTPLQERFVERYLQLSESDQTALLHALLRVSDLMDAHEIDAAPMLTPGVDVRTE